MQNTISFGPDAQNEDVQTGKGLGLLGIGGALKVSKDQKDSQKILKKKPAVPKFGEGPGSDFSQKNAGMVSVVAMTPLQGMHLINPDQL